MIQSRSTKQTDVKEESMRKRASLKTRIVSVFLALTVLLSMQVVFAPVSDAAESFTPGASGTQGFKSTNDPDDVVTVTVTPTGFDVYCKHSESYEGMETRLLPYDGGSAVCTKKVGEEDTAVSGLAANSDWTLSYDLLEEDAVADGMYWVFIYKYDESDPKSQYLPFMRGPLISVRDGAAALMTYAGAKSNNSATDKTVTATKPFMTKDMSDMKYLLFDRDINASAESAYYKKVADSVVSSGDTNYIKAKKLFKWVAGNFYYDHVHTTGDAYDDPYYNLINMRGKKTANGNAENGNVALRCDGYAGIYCALVRSQGIPCRIITGRHVEPAAGKNWGTSSSKHTWCEVYVNSRWIVVDPCSGSYSEYRNGVYTRSPQVMYEYFDMTEDALSYSHSAEKVGGAWLTVKQVAKPTVKKSTASKVKVTWSKVANATKYEIQYSSKKASGYKTLKVTDDVKTATVTMKQGYWYRVRGYTFQNANRINGAWSMPVQFKIKVAKPAAPTVKKASAKKVKITWKKVSNATKYEIWYSKKKSSGYKKLKVTGNVKSATVNGIKGTYIYYKVRGYTFVNGTRVNGAFSAPKKYKLK